MKSDEIRKICGDQQNPESVEESSSYIPKLTQSPRIEATNSVSSSFVANVIICAQQVNRYSVCYYGKVFPTSRELLKLQYV